MITFKVVLFIYKFLKSLIILNDSGNAIIKSVKEGLELLELPTSLKLLNKTIIYFDIIEYENYNDIIVNWIDLLEPKSKTPLKDIRLYLTCPKKIKELKQKVIKKIYERWEEIYSLLVKELNQNDITDINKEILLELTKLYFVENINHYSILDYELLELMNKSKLDKFYSFTENICNHYIEETR